MTRKHFALEHGRWEDTEQSALYQLMKDKSDKLKWNISTIYTSIWYLWMKTEGEIPRSNPLTDIYEWK